jgi:iron(III) transport system substrate-binding protein
MARPPRNRIIGVLLLVSAAAFGCGSNESPSDDADPAAAATRPMTLFTCANEKTEQAVVDNFTGSHPGSKIDVFRAPTGQLNARIAGDVRSGGLKADVIWACDPLTMNSYAGQGLIDSWKPANASAIPAQYQTADYVGAHLLYVVAVVHKDVPAPTAWADLTKPDYKDAVAFPSPGFAASALGMLGYFAATPGYGLDYFKALKANGAVQVNTPDEVLTGVASGTYKAGITLANSAYAAQKKGSPIEIAWPQPGAVAVYGPIAVTTKKDVSPIAEEFVTYVSSRDGQAAMAGTGVYVTMEGESVLPVPDSAPIVSPDWPKLFADTDSLLRQYRAIYGG